MAEVWTRAFGRYLRMLRERRGLSLEDVHVLSQSFAERLIKGYLSRVENGKQRMGLAKVIPLSRIYEVPSDVLLERMELDLELDQVGSPDTEGKTYAELTQATYSALKRGYKWDGYAFAREALRQSGCDAVGAEYRDQHEQVGHAVMNCASAARALGRTRFALYELRYLETCVGFSPRLTWILLERISSCLRSLNDSPQALRYADAAVDAARASKSKSALGCAYANRAHLSHHSADCKSAAETYLKAYKLFEEVNQRDDCAVILNNLAQCYFDMKRFSAARRSARAAEQLSRTLNYPRPLALSQIILGEIDEREKKPLQATRHWKEAADVAKQLNDKQLRFKVDFALFRHSLSQGEIAIARAAQRRLKRLERWMPADTEEVALYRELLAQSVDRLA